MLPEESPQQIPPELPQESREPTSGERLFVGADGHVRPAVKAIAFGITAYFVSAVAVGIVGSFLVGVSESLQFAILSSVSLAAIGGITWFFLRVGDGAGWNALGLSFRAGSLRRIGAGIGIGFALQLGIATALVLTKTQHYDARVALDAHSWAQLALDVWLFAAAATAEELLFRGYALQRLIDAAGPVAAVVATSIAFGLAHIWNPSASPFSTLNTVLAGLLFGVAYLRTRDMWLQCGIHAAWNFFMGPIFCLPVSGINFGPRTFITHITGRAVWTGGSYGPEGGLVGTSALLAGILWVLAGFREPVLPTIDGRE